MGPRLARLPITESGCAGGVVALARARDYLLAHPRDVGSRPGPGVRQPHLPALGPLGHQRRVHRDLRGRRRGGRPGGPRAPPLRAAPALARIVDADSVFFPGTPHLMGFRLRNQGLQIVLDRDLAPFVRREVGPVRARPSWPRAACRRTDVTRWILHPGGRRIIEVMAERLGLGPGDLAATEAVLAEHGNMSSVTVLFVLDEMLRRGGIRGRREGGAGGVRSRLRCGVRPARVLLTAVVDLRQRANDPERSTSAFPRTRRARSLDDLRFVNRWLGQPPPPSSAPCSPHLAAPAAPASSTWVAARATCRSS